MIYAPSSSKSDFPGVVFNSFRCQVLWNLHANHSVHVSWCKFWQSHFVIWGKKLEVSWRQSSEQFRNSWLLNFHLLVHKFTIPIDRHFDTSCDLECRRLNPTVPCFFWKMIKPNQVLGFLFFAEIFNLFWVGRCIKQRTHWILGCRRRCQMEWTIWLNIYCNLGHSVYQIGCATINCLFQWSLLSRMRCKKINHIV